MSPRRRAAPRTRWRRPEARAPRRRDGLRPGRPARAAACRAPGCCCRGRPPRPRAARPPRCGRVPPSAPVPAGTARGRRPRDAPRASSHRAPPARRDPRSKGALGEGREREAKAGADEELGREGLHPQPARGSSASPASPPAMSTIPVRDAHAAADPRSGRDGRRLMGGQRHHGDEIKPRRRRRHAPALDEQEHEQEERRHERAGQEEQGGVRGQALAALAGARQGRRRPHPAQRHQSETSASGTGRGRSTPSRAPA